MVRALFYEVFSSGWLIFRPFVLLSLGFMMDLVVLLLISPFCVLSMRLGFNVYLAIGFTSFVFDFALLFSNIGWLSLYLNLQPNFHIFQICVRDISKVVVC